MRSERAPCGGSVCPTGMAFPVLAAVCAALVGSNLHPCCKPGRHVNFVKTSSMQGGPMRLIILSSLVLTASALTQAPRLEQYEPLPLPKPGRNAEAPEGAMRSYDPTTGRELLHKAGNAGGAKLFDATRALVPSHLAKDGGRQFSPNNYGPLARVATPRAWPWAPNCKLFIRTRTNRNYVCSGTLIDGRHVLTAGHCVYPSRRRGMGLLNHRCPCLRWIGTLALV